MLSWLNIISIWLIYLSQPLYSHDYSIYWIRKGRPRLVRSQSQSEPIFVTWSLYLKWLEALLVCTMARHSIRLKSSLKWLAITLLSSLFHTSQLSMVDLVLVLPILLGSFLWSEVLFCSLDTWSNFMFVAPLVF